MKTINSLVTLMFVSVTLMGQTSSQNYDELLERITSKAEYEITAYKTKGNGKKVAKSATYVKKMKKKALKENDVVRIDYATYTEILYKNGTNVDVRYDCEGQPKGVTIVIAQYPMVKYNLNRESGKGKIGISVMNDINLPPNGLAVVSYGFLSSPEQGQVEMERLMRKFPFITKQDFHFPLGLTNKVN